MGLSFRVMCALLLGSVLGIAACGSQASSADCSTGGHGASGGGGGSGAAGGAGGGTSSTTSAGEGGSGEMVFYCDDPVDCPGIESDCAMRACEQGRCVQAFVAAGTPVAHQVAGDCRQLLCDGQGNASEALDNADVPVDGNPCTEDLCVSTTPMNPPSAVGNACGEPLGSRKCDGAGKCVQCVDNGQCNGQICKDHLCVAATCDNQLKDPLETDIDCGGACPPCAAGKVCILPADCQSASCVGGTCQP